MPPLSVTSRWSCIRSITGCCGRRVELGRVGVGQAEHVAGELDRHRLQPEAQPEARHALLAGVAGGGDLALDAAGAEAAGDDDAVEVGQAAGGQQALDLLGLDPVDLDLGAVVEPGVLEALDDRQVGVGQLDVLADQADRTGSVAASTSATTCSHGPRSSRCGRLEPQHLADDVVEALVVEDQRQLVDVAGVGGVDDGPARRRRTGWRSCASGRR